ncbi:hypothetical protein Gotur_020289 [Gossypium turneri]
MFWAIYQAAVEEGIVVGGGCTLLRLASKVDAIKDSLDNDEEKVNRGQMLLGACSISGQDILDVRLCGCGNKGTRACACWEPHG